MPPSVAPGSLKCSKHDSFSGSSLDAFNTGKQKVLTKSHDMQTYDLDRLKIIQSLCCSFGCLRPPLPGVNPLPGVSFGFGLLSGPMGPGPALGPGLIPARQPHHHPVGAGPVGAVGGAIGPAPQMGPDWGRHHPMQPPPMHNQHQQLPQHPQQPQQIPQQLQQLPPQQQQIQPKAVGYTPPLSPPPDAFHQDRVPAPELVQTPEPLKAATLPREAPPLQEVSQEPPSVRPHERAAAPAAERRTSGEKYVPPVKRYSQGENRTENRTENRAEKREEKTEKQEKHEKRFEAAAIERRRHSRGPRSLLLHRRLRVLDCWTARFITNSSVSLLLEVDPIYLQHF